MLRVVQMTTPVSPSTGWNASRPITSSGVPSQGWVGTQPPTGQRCWKRVGPGTLHPATTGLMASPKGCTRPTTVRSALFHYTTFLIRMYPLMTRYGGQWLLSDGQAEQDLADAVYRIGWHANEMTQRDESYLRALHRTAGGDLNTFLHLLKADTQTGPIIHDEWQEWLDDCRCSWNPEDSRHDREHFPTARTHPGIRANCFPHNMVRACTDYMLLVDEDWRRVADWYGLEEKVRIGVDVETLTEAVQLPPT